MLDVSVKQECFLKFFSDFQILSVLFGILLRKLFLHHFDVNFEFGCLFTNYCIDEKIFLIKRTNLINCYVGRFVEIEATDYLCITLLNAHVSHFP